MNDIKIAKNRLKEKKFSLVIVKNGKIIYETRDHGLKSLIRAIERFKEKMKGVSVADKTVGRPVALLCLYADIAAIYAITISEEAIKLLKKADIICEYEKSIPIILNRKKNDICPFEKYVIGLENPKEAFKKLKFFALSL